MQQFFYDGQIRRFIIQFIRMVSNFQVEFGKDRNGNQTLQRVPVIYGDSSKQAAQILRNNSENTLNTVPAMSVYVTDLKYARDRVQDPTFVGKLSLRERHFDPLTGTYDYTQGDAFTVERLMPVPYNLTLKLDIWTSNTEQKLQLVEQLSLMFNPAMEIQSTDNYIDWTSLSYVLLTDIVWSSRSIPVGTETPIDVATLTFEIPIWLSSPAKVKKLGVIQNIIASIYDNNGNLNEAIYDESLMISRQYLTPLGYGVILLNNQLELVKPTETVDDPISEQIIKKLAANAVSTTTLTVSSGIYVKPGMEVLGTGVSANCSVISVAGNTINVSANVTANTGSRITFNSVTTKVGTADTWRSVVNVYGTLNAGISQIRLTSDDGVTEVVGTVAYHPTNDNILLYTPDSSTLPSNTLSPVNAIIDPERSRPNSDLSTPTAGTRYLIVNDYITSPGEQPYYNWVGADSEPLSANANDIIEFNGSYWIVSFDSKNESDINYVTNLTTGIQYKWNGADWVKSYEGFYRAGEWALVL